MDLSAGVAALQAADGDGESASLEGSTGDGQQAGGHIAAGTADGEHALLLGVQVEELTALQGGHVHGHRAQHADLLVYGEHGLQAGVGDVLGVQNG